MFKKFKRLILLIIILSLFYFYSFAAEEKIAITTYYPSPHGIYNELQANKISVGDVNNDGELSSLDHPPLNGQLYVARSVIYNPQTSLSSSGIKGEMVYNDATNGFYFYNGSSWRELSATYRLDYIIVRNSIGNKDEDGKDTIKNLTVNCPPDYIRVGCSSAINWDWNTSSFFDGKKEKAGSWWEDKANYGAAPVEDNGCAARSTSAESLSVFAYCIRLVKE